MTEARANAMLASELKSMRERREAKLVFIKLPEKLMEYPTWRQKAMSKILACGLPGSVTLKYIKQCNHWIKEQVLSDELSGEMEIDLDTKV